MTKVLITGINGFVGSHLVEHLLDRYPNQEIHGLVRWRSSFDNIKHLFDKITLHEGDLCDRSSIEKVVFDAEPKHIYHLAAQSYVPFSFDAPSKTFETNIIGTLNLFESIRSVNRRDPLFPKVHICSSSEVYGQVYENELPIREEQPMRPMSPYAISKATKDRLATFYNNVYHVETFVTRAFTHSGPRRGHVFVDSSFARQIALIEAGKQLPTLHVGNLNSVRTFCDVKDVVRGYAMLMNEKKNEHKIVGEAFNIGGKESMKIGDMLKMLKDMTRVKINVKKEPGLMRPADVTLQIPDITKIYNTVGWSPNIDYEVTLSSMLNYWRKNV